MIENGEDFNPSIRTGEQLIERYSDVFAQQGGDPDACEGVAWAKTAVEAEPNISASDVIERINEKISDGTANHGWLIGVLNLLWGELSQRQRLALIAMLADGGAYKWVASRELTDPEKTLVRGLLKRDRAVAVLRRLDG